LIENHACPGSSDVTSEYSIAVTYFSAWCRYRYVSNSTNGAGLEAIAPGVYPKYTPIVAVALNIPGIARAITNAPKTFLIIQLPL
jgi:hypothetical protein